MNAQPLEPDRQTDRFGVKRNTNSLQYLRASPAAPDARPASPSPGQKSDVLMAPVQPQIWGRDKGRGSGSVSFDLLPLTQTQDDPSGGGGGWGRKGREGFDQRMAEGAGT